MYVGPNGDRNDGADSSTRNKLYAPYAASRPSTVLCQRVDNAVA